MLGHTPGPWKCDCGMVEDNGGVPIAWMDREPGNGTAPVERDANARLISAAPDLLAAAQEMYADRIQEWDAGVIPDEKLAADLARWDAAIAKAVGE